MLFHLKVEIMNLSMKGITNKTPSKLVYCLSFYTNFLYIINRFFDRNGGTKQSGFGNCAVGCCGVSVTFITTGQW